jgi:hypothetical protein
MKLENYCQSCSMPLDNPELQGTERDGSKSLEYCIYCYKEGVFTNPDITLKDMTSRVIHQMEKMNFNTNAIDMAINTLPNLKRWRSQSLHAK